ncbi:NUDIX domain-containing protein [Candidatus Uhrbacteria bacterium]|nr:NUDIX domain-containing protein [Candidatus Uhrbacteria bacterium]
MTRFTLLCAVHLFLVRDGKILMLRRANTGYEDGNYSVPAGHLDGGESVTQAMAREAREEACLAIDPHNLQVVHVMHRRAADHERVDFFLTADTWNGELSIGEPDKCDALEWFDLERLPENVVPYVRASIEQFQTKKPFSEFGWKEQTPKILR